MKSLILLAGLSSVFVLFSGCYTLKQGFTMLGYLSRAVPLEDLEKPGSNESDRLFAGQVRDIRRFAMEELGLRETANYTRYVSLDRDYLAAVVSASGKASFDRHEWWFPIVGRVPYKGFFNPDGAKKEAEKLRKKDLDVWIRPVDAFSTLGWFKDPLYSYMKEYPVHELADLIIHELFHATVFLKGQAQFNEELAEFAGSKGAQLYMEEKYGLDSAEYKAIGNAREDRAAYIAFLQDLIKNLESLYDGDSAAEVKLAEKERIIGEAQRRFEDSYDEMFKSPRYRSFAALKVNNAYLELFRLYYAKDNYLEEFYDESGLGLAQFIAAAKTIKARGSPKEQLKTALGL